MATHIERWKDYKGNVYEVVVYPEKKGTGDGKVFVVKDRHGDELGHITVHGDGKVNKHGIFNDLSIPSDSFFNKL